MRELRKVISLLMCLSLLLGTVPAFAVTQGEIDALEAQRDVLRALSEEVQRELDSLANDISSLLEKKSALDEQSELLRQDILLLEQQIALYDSIIAEAKEASDSAEQCRQEHYELYCSRVRSMEENSAWSYIIFLFSASGLSDFIARIIDIGDILSYDIQLRREYEQACLDAQDALAEYEAEQQAQLSKQAELDDQQIKLQEKIDASARLIAQLEETEEGYRAYWDSVEAELAKVQELIDEKSAELWSQQQAAAPQPPSVSVAGGYYAWPSYSSYITSPFGPRTHPIYGQLKPHTGVDIGAAYGTAVTAAADGVVTLAVLDFGSVGYGTYVAIYHPNGTTTLYAHMSGLAVSPGQSVSRGQVIGYVGSTGASTGPHIHFEIRVNGICVDPMQYF